MTHTNNFAQRLANVHQEISADVLAYVNTNALDKAAAALSAARELAADGEANAETIIRVAEAAAYAQRVLDKAAKYGAAQAVLLDHSPKDAATRIHVSEASLRRWKNDPDGEFEDAAGEWWQPEAPTEYVSEAEVPAPEEQHGTGDFPTTPAGPSAVGEGRFPGQAPG